MSDTSFLPADYLAKRAEARTNLICLILFLVVMAAVAGAFLVTNRQWTFVRAEQERINVQYVNAAEQIKQLNELEQQKNSMLQKAELAGSLVERVPRSILLAELINRMPPRLGLLEFELQSKKITTSSRVIGADRDKGATGSLSKKPKRGQTKQDAQREILTAVQTPTYEVTLSIVGAAPTDLEVSRYLAELNAYPLLSSVTLEYSEEKTINERKMREFRLQLKLDPEADIRVVQPLIKQREIQNPMDDTMRFSPVPSESGASAVDFDRVFARAETAIGEEN